MATPTPWEFDGNCGGYITESGDKIARAYSRSDAEFIVKAVNAMDAFRNADEKDWAHLDMFIPQSGHGQFWRAVFAELRTAIKVAP